MKNQIQVCPLVEEDVVAISEAFNQIGWNKPPSLFAGYLQEQEAGERLVWVAFANRHGEQSEAIQQNNNDPIASSSRFLASDVFVGYVGYESAQRVYVKCWYIPDGKGITYNYDPTIPGNSYPLDCGLRRN